MPGGGASFPDIDSQFRSKTNVCEVICEYVFYGWTNIVGPGQTPHVLGICAASDHGLRYYICRS